MRDRSAFLKPIAHRGLHDAAKGIVENTRRLSRRPSTRATASSAMCARPRCATPMVFHDLTLDRLIEGEGRSPRTMRRR